MKFSPRLRALYEACPEGQALADLCCDHGHLGVYAYTSMRFPRVLFVDQVGHTMQNLEARFDQYVRRSDHPTSAIFLTSDAGKIPFALEGTVVIAGIGGVNMMRILNELKSADRLKAHTLILAPHRHRELFEHTELFGLPHVRTLEVTEKGIIRPIFIFGLI
ncbi:MAG: SAM-dependent methyltransferase [Bdellovibrionales bacterium]|nr:SAM-dependent methyltransferase [Oligoflexia bacterium]